MVPNCFLHQYRQCQCFIFFFFNYFLPQDLFYWVFKDTNCIYLFGKYLIIYYKWLENCQQLLSPLLL
jgi:hypothetical protein